MSDQPVRVVFADDQRAVREALATVLDVVSGIEVVGQAADGEEAVALTLELEPDVVLMDLRMPGTDGVAATARITAEAPAVNIVVLTTFADDSSILGALQAGAVGYLTKDAGRDQIALAVRSAAAGQAVMDPAVQEALLRAAVASAAPTPASSPSSEPLPDDLTAREADVLRAIAAGRTNREIAAELYIAEVTVKSHVNHLFAKIGARSRAEAVRYAYDRGLVAP
jgi:DNA-binding NarL/FixJ family response regulator